MRYDEIDFGEANPKTVTFRYRADKKTTVSLWLSDDVTLGSFNLPAAKKWKEVTLPVTGPTVPEGRNFRGEPSATGLRNLKLRVDEGGLDLDWVSFD